MARARSSQTPRKSRVQGKRQAQGRSRGSSGGARPGRAAPAQTRQAPPKPLASGQAAAAQGAVTAGPRAASPKRTTAVGGPPTWLELSTLILSLGGLGVSIYLTIAHYTAAVSLACPATSTINCEKVTTSPQSVVFGIPVAVLGLAFFVFMVAVNNPRAWHARFRVIHLSRVLSLIAGMVFVIYLIYVELFTVNAICLWCTSVHVITFALFVLIVLSAAMWGIEGTADRSA